VGDLNNNVQPLLIQINDYLENGLNTKIEQEKYYLTVPVPVSYLDFKGQRKPTIGVPLPKLICVRSKYDYYRNYYFGMDVDSLKTATDTNIYR